ncbi:MAG: calcium/sodium antiporter [Nanoarchaeota archaeon]|nr:calcium/sodium antiporter [Nanoarchaeota archaeon]
MINFFLIVLGLFGLWLGADLVINSSQRIAKSLNISEASIGLTILSIGTSLPEITTHIVSSIDILNGVEASGIAVGTNVGSNLFQITMVMGIVGLFVTIKSNDIIIKRDYLLMLGAILLLWLFSLGGFISRLEGIILAGIYLMYLIYLSKKEKVRDKNPYQTKYIKDFILIAAGIALLLFSADFVVDKAIILSENWGIAESFVGTLIIGLGTALPELTTAIIGLMKGANDLSLGTLVGSNITNPMLALGIGAAISGYTVDKYLLWFDIPVWFLFSLIILMFFYRSHKLNRSEAVLCILMFLSYFGFKVFYLRQLLG